MAFGVCFFTNILISPNKPLLWHVLDINQIYLFRAHQRWLRITLASNEAANLRMPGPDRTGWRGLVDGMGDRKVAPAKGGEYERSEEAHIVRRLVFVWSV